MIEDQMRYSRFSPITKMINTNSELHEILMNIINAISKEVVQCSAVGIFLPEKDGTFKGFVANPEQINGISIDALIIDPKKDLMVKEMIESKNTIYIPDTSKDSRIDPNLNESLNITSLLALPILVETKLLGLIFLIGYGSPMKLTSFEIKSIEPYVNIAAVAIQNANHLMQKEDLLAEKQCMLNIAGELARCSSKEDSLDICFSYLKKMFGSHIDTFAYLLDPIDENNKCLIMANKEVEAETFRMKECFEAIIQEVVRSKQTIYIPDTDKDSRVNSKYFRNKVKSLLAIPFISGGKVTGAIVVVDSEHSKKDYHQYLIKIAELLVDATAPVYSNLQYLDQLENMVEERTKELAAANERVISVIGGVTGGFLALDKDWKYSYVNQHLYLPKNKTAKDVLGKCIWEVYPELVGSLFYKELHRAMSERVEVAFEMHGIYDDYWFEVVAYPFEDGICCLFKDITEKKKYEMEFKRLSSLDLIGQMAAGISHEIRNPMATVRGFLQLLKMDNNMGNQEHYFEIMIEELDRANAIISEFLSIGNTKTSDRQMRDLNTIISDMSPLIEIDAATQNKFIKIETEDVPELLLNHNEIRQLLINLYRNALEAMDTGKTLHINTYKENDCVVLSVRDQGKGISPDVMEKLGTPFFTTKDNGTGLGLGVCYAIAARHNATIEIETGPQGTTFFVRFKIGKRDD